MRWRGKRSAGSAWMKRMSVGALIGMSWLALLAVATAIPTARAAGSASVSIIIPVPTGAATSGPVGANVTITASGLNTSDRYSLGYASASVVDGCATGYTDMQLEPFSPNPDGTYSTTFAWPSTAKDTANPYVICLADATLLGTPPVQSTTTFQVLDTQAPRITLKHILPSVAPGTPQPTPQSDSAYLAGDVMQITGDHFPTGGLGGNTTLGVYLTTAQAKSLGDLQQGQSLNIISGSVTPDANGHFNARVTMPTTKPDGTPLTSSSQYYLYVASGDGSATALPSLVAVKQITLAPAATPTPTATATSTSTVAASPSATPGGHQTGGSTSNLGLIVGLGGLSVVLFIIGVILLASAAGMPRGGQY